MAITFFGSASTPADNGTQDSSADRGAVVANMVAGDYVYYVCSQRSLQTLTLSQEGGQTWTYESNVSNGSSSERIARCRFNGTWSATPLWHTTGSVTAPMNTIMIVFRPTAGINIWSSDVAQQAANFAAPTTPFDVVRVGQTSIGADTVTIASWFVADNTTWALQTGGWTNPSGVTQVRNLAGSQLSSSFAYKIQTSPGATGSVTNRQTAVTGRAGHSRVQTFTETEPAGDAPEINALGVQSVSTTSYTAISVTPSEACTVYAVAVKAGDATPSKAQIIAGQNQAGSAAFAAASKAITGLDTFTLGSGLTRPYYDIHAVAHHAIDGDGNIVTLATQLLAAPSGYQYKVLDFSGGTPSESLAAGASPAAATGDLGIVSANGSAPGSCPVFLELNAVPFLSSASAATPRQTIYWRFFDNSADAYSDADYVPSWFNNQSPIPMFPLPVVNLTVNIAMMPIDLRQYFTDPETDVFTVTDDGASAPTGTSVTASIWSGTPTVIESAHQFNLLATDAIGDQGLGAITVNVGGITIPDVAGFDQPTASAQLSASQLTPSTATEYSGSVATGLVIGTVPAAGTVVVPFTEVVMRVSLGAAPVVSTTHFSYGVPRRFGSA